MTTFSKHSLDLPVLLVGMKPEWAFTGYLPRTTAHNTRVTVIQPLDNLLIPQYVVLSHSICQIYFIVLKQVASFNGTRGA